jgi:cytochrome P450
MVTPVTIGTPAFVADPHPLLDVLRAAAPAVPVRTPAGAPAWLLTRAGDIRAGFADPRLSLGARPGGADAGSLVGADPPRHTHLRRLAAPWLASRRVAAHEGGITAAADRLLPRPRVSAVDLMACFARPFAFEVMAELCGLAPERRAELYCLTSTVFDRSGADRAGQRSALYDFMRTELADRAAGGAGDLLSAMYAAWSPAGPVSRADFTSLCLMVLLAGADSTAQAIGLAVRSLLANPDQLAWLRADPGRVPAAVEELLRYATPGPCGTPRTLTAQVTVAGTTLPAGSRVLLSIDAANHDPAEHADPHLLRLDRPTARHLSFGLGPHYCPGAALARLELSTALAALLDRYPLLRPADLPQRPHWRGNHLNRGLAALPLILE